MKAIFHPEAHEEMIESARLYEGRCEGLGSDFLTAVEETTRHIEQFPEAGSIDRANVRKRLVSGFPFTILYEIQPDRILIGRPLRSLSHSSCASIARHFCQARFRRAKTSLAGVRSPVQLIRRGARR